MCGIFGVYNSPYASQYAYLGIYALQHRGQESVGIASADGEEIYAIRKPGLVLESIKREDMFYLKGTNAIAHVRYSTAGDPGGLNAQPIVRDLSFGKVAIVHNGNLVNYVQLRERFEAKGVKPRYSSDTEMFLLLMDEGQYVPEGVDIHIHDRHILPRIFYMMKEAKGAYSLLILHEDKFIAVRDPYGFRPLTIGKKEGALLFSSESCAFDILEGEFLGEIKPGEILIADRYGIRRYRFPHRERIAMCIFEHIYFARPDSFIFGEEVYGIRKELGKQLAREDDVEGDVVVPVPDSGVVPALGYSEERGIPFEMGLIRNHYVGRSFIEPTDDLRNIKVLMKLSPNRSVLKGKKIIVIDDSLVRGTTSRRIVNMLKRAGVKEVHLRIASPPVIGPCYYGIDTPTREELIANRMSVEDIGTFLGVDSIKYLSLEGLRKVIKDPEDYCDACFSLNYPVLEKETCMQRA